MTSELGLRGRLGQWRRRLLKPYFGAWGRVTPLSGWFGFERGTPVDRRYIETFLARNSGDIRGRALEIGDAGYCRQFGGGQIERQDVLHIHADNPEATIVGDLVDPGVLPPGAFDCMVLTQTLQMIYDMKAAIREIHAGLAPGGVLLLTAPGISQIERGEWRETWYWSLTPLAASRLFGEVFGEENVTVECHGNVYAATAFLQGACAEELSARKLDVVDPHYPVIVAVRARRSDATA